MGAFCGKSTGDCIILLFLHLFDAIFDLPLVEVHTVQQHKSRCPVLKHGANERFVDVHLCGLWPRSACKCALYESKCACGASNVRVRLTDGAFVIRP